MGENNNTAKVITILDYLGPLFLLGLFVEKDNPDVKFHTNQGLILFLFDVVVGIAGGVIQAIFHLIPFLGFIGTLVSSVLGLACLVLTILGIVNAAQGSRQPLPVIGGLLNIIK